jgi:hypothetical protein
MDEIPGVSLAQRFASAIQYVTSQIYHLLPAGDRPTLKHATFNFRPNKYEVQMATNYPSSSREHPQPARRHRQSPFRYGLLLALIGILFTSCTPVQPGDPVSVVKAAFERINEGDLNGYMEFFSDDAVMAYRGGRFEGPEDIRAHMELNVMPTHTRTELSNISLDGNVVTYTYDIYEYEGDIHLGPFDDGVDVIVDGKIIFDGTKGYLLIECNTDPSQAFCPGN